MLVAITISIINFSHKCKNDRRPRCCSENSMNGWDNMFHLTQKKTFYVPQHPLGEDGLVSLRSPVQEMLKQIEDDYQVRKSIKLSNISLKD